MAKKSEVMVVDSKGRPAWLTTRNILIALVVLVVAGGIVYWFGFRKDNGAEKAANTTDQKALESSLKSSVAASNDPNGIIYAANRLIAGQKDKTFTIGNVELSQIYLNRADAYRNLGQYKNAASDYAQSISLDSTNKYAALQGEVESRYKLGDRKELIPLYQQLIEIEKNSQNPMHNSEVAQYEQDIQTLQNGGEISF